MRLIAGLILLASACASPDTTDRDMRPVDAGVGAPIDAGNNAPRDAAQPQDAAPPVVDAGEVIVDTGPDECMPSMTLEPAPGSPASDEQHAICTFGEILLGEFLICEIVINNRGQRTLTLDSIVFDPANPAVRPTPQAEPVPVFAFASDANTPIRIADGFSVSVMISFTPPAAENYEGSLRLESSDPCFQDSQGIIVDLVGAGVAPEPMTCEEAMACMLACPLRELGCRRACIDGTREDQQPAAEAVMRCAQQNRCALDEACINENCALEIAACAGQGPQPGDELDCPGFVACRLGCGNVQACAEGCRNRIAQAHMVASRSIDRCAIDNRCRDIDCLLANCAEQARACGLQGGGDQELSCAGLIECVNACANDMACTNACFGRIRPQSQDVVASLRGCMGNNACRDMGCAERDCNREFQTCSQDR